MMLEMQEGLRIQEGEKVKVKKGVARQGETHVHLQPAAAIRARGQHQGRGHEADQHRVGPDSRSEVRSWPEAGKHSKDVAIMMRKITLKHTPESEQTQCILTLAGVK